MFDAEGRVARLNVGAEVFFFFFQAEDGIRDHCVTGVPDVCSSDLTSSTSMSVTSGGRSTRRVNGACSTRSAAPGTRSARPSEPAQYGALDPHPLDAVVHGDSPVRSEERRVGKECRSPRSTYDE